MVFLESALDSKFNPLIHLGRKGTFGLSGFVNKFNAEAELLDDLVSRSGWFRVGPTAYCVPVFLRMTFGLQKGTRYLGDCSLSV